MSLNTRWPPTRFRPKAAHRAIGRRSTARRARCRGRNDVAVPVHFLGLWDTVKVPGTPALCEEDWLGNVVSGRHAVAIDGGVRPVRGMLSDATTTPSKKSGSAARTAMSSAGLNAYWPLADITLDWMLDGVVKAGAIISDESLPRTPAPTELDALAEGARSLRLQGARGRARACKRRRLRAREFRLLASTAVAHRLVGSGLGRARRAAAGARHRADGEGGAAIR